MKKKVTKTKLNLFSLNELYTLREEVLSSTTKAELLAVITKTIIEKERQMPTTINEKIPTAYLPIDREYQDILYLNGIDNLSQLLQVKRLKSLKRMTEGAYEQISWVREFFDMTQLEEIPYQERTTMNVAKVIVKQANEVRKSK